MMLHHAFLLMFLLHHHIPAPVEHLAKLGLLLGKNWPKALQVVDQGEVHCYQGQPSGRCIFEVIWVWWWGVGACSVGACLLPLLTLLNCGQKGDAQPIHMLQLRFPNVQVFTATPTVSRLRVPCVQAC